MVLKLNINKTKLMAIGTTASLITDSEDTEVVESFYNQPSTVKEQAAD